MFAGLAAAAVGVLGLSIGLVVIPEPAPVQVAASAEANHAAVALGKQLYMTSCASCHGAHGQGMPRMGAALAGSRFVIEHDEASLVDFLIQGRSVDDPANQTRLPMPPRGGNPTLKDRDLQFIAAYVRTLAASSAATADVRE